MAKTTKKQKMLAEKLGDNMELRSFGDALKLLRELANELNAPRPMAPDGGPRSEPFTAGCFAACRIGNDGPGLT